MLRAALRDFRPGRSPMNLTAVIDIVFLLMIFFAIVSRFIEAENIPVKVPDGCEYARNEPPAGAGPATVTVAARPGSPSLFAVGADVLPAEDCQGLATGIAEKLNARLEGLEAEAKIVTLRIDSEVTFAEARCAIAAVAGSAATGVRFAVIDEPQKSRRR